MSTNGERFPAQLEIAFGEGAQRQVLVYEQVTWPVGDEQAGLRYGENPDQQAALYKLINGNLAIGEVRNVTPGKTLASTPELLHRDTTLSKSAIADADAALNVLRYLTDDPVCVIVKHQNPCGAATRENLADAFHKAHMADRLAAAGACAAFNRALDLTAAEAIIAGETNVIVAPDYEEKVVDLLVKNKSRRVLRIDAMDKLAQWAGRPFLDFKSLIDGGLIAQWSYVPAAHKREDCRPASTMHHGKEHRVRRQPKAQEWDDLLLAWKIQAGLNSHSVVYVKEGVTVGIGAGEPHAVGAAEIARDKAYRKLAERLAWDRFGVPFLRIENRDMHDSIWEDAIELKGGLIGAVMAVDGALLDRDAADIALAEGITAVIQPGGAENDFDAIQACNEKHAAMVFTGQRSFRH